MVTDKNPLTPTTMLPAMPLLDKPPSQDPFTAHLQETMGSDLRDRVLQDHKAVLALVQLLLNPDLHMDHLHLETVDLVLSKLAAPLAVVLDPL